VDLMIRIEGTSAPPGLYSGTLRAIGDVAGAKEARLDVTVISTDEPDLSIHPADVGVTGSLGPLPLDAGEPFDVSAIVRNIGLATASSSAPRI
jgi:hypothetical protein